jgi:hypothetical protein
MKKYVKMMQGVFADKQKRKQCKFHSIHIQNDEKKLKSRQAHHHW